MRNIHRLRNALVSIFILLFVLAACSPTFAQHPQGAKQKSPVKTSSIARAPELQSGDRFAPIDAIVKQAIRADQIPGAVVLIAHNGEVVYRKAFGSRSIEPRREPMTLDTIFDVASLTKTMVTAMSLMRLVELGQVRLNDPVARYIPEFAHNGKEDITIRQLATHFSGLREDLERKQPWPVNNGAGKQEAYRRAHDETPIAPPGAVFRYSDINFIVLGEVIERVSGMPLEKYAQSHIFAPLGLAHTQFLPPASWLPLIAPTEYDERNQMLRGVVHDPTARLMGGVAGHAGLFSTADDMAVFAQALLDGKGPLSSITIQKMTTPQQPPTATVLRGIGWDIDSPFSSNRGELLPVGSFGHTGFTGTSLWIDPATKTYIIILSNSVHPHSRPGGGVVALRTKIATATAAALDLKLGDDEQQRLADITGYNESMTGTRRFAARNGHVKTGLDVLEEHDFAALLSPDYKAAKPRKIGLLTNQTGVDAQGRRIVDVLAHVPGIELAAIFSPEHGVTGTLDTTDIANSRDQATGVPVYSVYGAKDAQRRPSPDIVKNLDAIVFDIQDAGARFYTYPTTLGYFLEAAKAAGIELIVLDRPNPITGSFVQGPMSEKGIEKFGDYFRLPIRHGMTIAELAKMFNEEKGIRARLKIVAMQGWQRGDWFDSTGITWTNPSPNLRSVAQATLYPGVGMVEGTNVSVGRGTDTPFEILGAPWITARQLADFLNARNISGVRFVPVQFTPTSSNYANQLCSGVNLIVTDRNAFEAAELGVELASALLKLYPNDYKIARMNDLLLDRPTFEAIQRGDDPRRIADEWRDGQQEFLQLRRKYLLY